MLEGKKLLLSNHSTDGEDDRAVSLLVALQPIYAGTVSPHRPLTQVEVTLGMYLEETFCSSCYLLSDNFIKK